MASNQTQRRRFLGMGTKLLLAVIGVMMAVPALGYFVAPLRRRLTQDSGDGFQDVGPVPEIPPGEWRLLSLEIVQQDGWKKSKVRHSFWIRRGSDADKRITVLSSICPHLGCPVNWHPDQSQFMCPCHGATFDPEGRRVAGPPPRAMDPLEFEIRAGRLWVRWQDFKIGVAERVAVGV